MITAGVGNRLRKSARLLLNVGNGIPKWCTAYAFGNFCGGCDRRVRFRKPLSSHEPGECHGASLRLARSTAPAPCCNYPCCALPTCLPSHSVTLQACRVPLPAGLLKQPQLSTEMGETADYEIMEEEMAEAARSQTEHTEASLERGHGSFT